MIAYLKGLGFKYTDKDTLNNREFTEIGTEVTMNLDTSVLGNIRTSTVYAYELFLSTRTYSVGLVQGIVAGANANGDMLTDVSATIEKQERGYLITLNFTMEDL